MMGVGWVVIEKEAETEKVNDILNNLISFTMPYFCCWFYVVTEWEIAEIMKLVLFQRWQESFSIRT